MVTRPVVALLPLPTTYIIAGHTILLLFHPAVRFIGSGRFLPEESPDLEQTGDR
jgi:hypothetical protein